MGVTSDGATRWAVILAGGDGARLRSLTERISGDGRPKQFCPVLGSATLLEATRRRVALGISPHRTLVVVTRPHEPFYAPLLADVWTRQLVVQPENRGTAPAILYALLRLATTGPADPVVIVPSDHYVSDDAAFMAHVDDALDAVTARPELVVLLGASPEGAQEEYGWIEPAEPLPGWSGGPLHRVRRFWEKPSRALAHTLRARGALWNTFVMAARVATLIRAIRDTVPALYQAFGRVRPLLHTGHEADAIGALYRELAPVDFSREVLAAPGVPLTVLPVRSVWWNDLGTPDRVLATARRVAAVGVTSGAA